MLVLLHASPIANLETSGLKFKVKVTLFVIFVFLAITSLILVLEISNRAKHLRQSKPDKFYSRHFCSIWLIFEVRPRSKFKGSRFWLYKSRSRDCYVRKYWSVISSCTTPPISLKCRTQIGLYKTSQLLNFQSSRSKVKVKVTHFVIFVFWP